MTKEAPPSNIGVARINGGMGGGKERKPETSGKKSNSCHTSRKSSARGRGKKRNE